MKSLKKLAKNEIHKMSMKIVTNPNYNEENWVNWTNYLETIPREILDELYNDNRPPSSVSVNAIGREIAEAYFKSLYFAYIMFLRML